MKNLLFVLPFLLLFQVAYCDVVPENSHYVQKCVKIINIDDFPDFVIVACIQSPTRREMESYIINSKECIETGYKFNQLYLMATKRRYFENKINDSIDWLNNRNIIESSISIHTEGGHVSNDNPISFVEEYYEIVEITDTNFVIYKCKELIRYNNGSPITLKKYPFPELRKKTKNIKNSEVTEIYSSIEVLNFLKALLLTIFIETLILFLLFKTKYKTLQIQNKRLLFVGVVASFTTLPYVWFVFPSFIQLRVSYIAVSECFAVVVESVLIFKLLNIEYKKALIVSIICNVISFSIGMFVNWIIYSPESVMYLIQSLFR